MLVDEPLAGDDRRTGAVRGRRALQLGQRVVDHRRVLDLLQRVLGLELRVRVVDRVLVVLLADPREVLRRGAVPLHVLAPGVAEHLRRERRAAPARAARHAARRACPSRFVRSVYFMPERAALHLLEADRQRASTQPALDRLARQEQRARAGRAVVVDVDDRDPGQAELVDRALTVGRVAVDVADVGLLDRVVGDAGVGERLRRRPPWPSPGSPRPWFPACRTSSSQHRSRTCGCSSRLSFDRSARRTCRHDDATKLSVGAGLADGDQRIQTLAVPPTRRCASQAHVVAAFDRPLTTRS